MGRRRGALKEGLPKPSNSMYIQRGYAYYCAQQRSCPHAILKTKTVVPCCDQPKLSTHHATTHLVQTLSCSGTEHCGAHPAADSTTLCVRRCVQWRTSVDPPHPRNPSIPHAWHGRQVATLHAKSKEAQPKATSTPKPTPAPQAHTCSYHCVQCKTLQTTHPQRPHTLPEVHRTLCCIVLDTHIPPPPTHTRFTEGIARPRQTKTCHPIHPSYLGCCSTNVETPRPNSPMN